MDKIPSLRKVTIRPAQLKVVDIDSQIKLQCRMEVTRTPSRNRLEAAFAEMSVATFLPVAPRVRMPIERKDERTNRIDDLVL